MERFGYWLSRALGLLCHRLVSSRRDRDGCRVPLAPGNLIPSAVKADRHRVLDLGLAEAAGFHG